MKADKLANGIEKTAQLHFDMMKNIADEIKRCWVVNQLDCTNHLSDEEFETLQGLIKKVELLKNGERK